MKPEVWEILLLRPFLRKKGYRTIYFWISFNFPYQCLFKKIQYKKIGHRDCLRDVMDQTYPIWPVLKRITIHFAVAESKAFDNNTWKYISNVCNGLIYISWKNDTILKRYRLKKLLDLFLSRSWFASSSKNKRQSYLFTSLIENQYRVLRIRTRLFAWFLCTLQDVQCNTEKSPNGEIF